MLKTSKSRTAIPVIQFPLLLSNPESAAKVAVF
jgi:hypothetical protein